MSNESMERQFGAPQSAADRNMSIQSHQEMQHLLFNYEAMNQLYRLAEVMASGRATVPDHLQKNAGDCMAIIMQAAQWRMNPFAVAQKTHIVSGKLGYEAQLVNAVITSMAPTKGRLQFKWFGEWERILGNFKEVQGKNGPYRVPNWNMKDETGLGVEVWATLKGEDEPRVLTLLLSQARVRNSTMWADDPKQQLAYLAIKRWSRLYCPDVIMGVYTPDELEEFGLHAGARDITPQTEARPEPEHYPAEKFEANFPKWQALIESGRKSAEDVIATVQSCAILTDEQQARIRDCEEQEVEPQTVEGELVE